MEDLNIFRAGNRIMRAPPLYAMSARYLDSPYVKDPAYCPPASRRLRRRLSASSDDSDCSDISWGSDIAAVGCDCISHNDEELEVASWLLFSDEQDFAIRPQPPSTTPRSEPPFSIIQSTPAHFFLQILFAILIWLNLIPNHLLRQFPAQPPPATSVFPRKKNIPRFGAIMNDGHHVKMEISEQYYTQDDIEYLVPPTPGTDEEVLRISVTNDYSYDKVESHALAPPDALRIYRVPLDKMISFGQNVMRFGMEGIVIRKPYDSFDTVKVVRQGHISWDLGNRDQRWILIGRNTTAIGKVLDRIERRPPPFPTRIKRFFLKIAYKLVAPWMPTWILY